MEYFNIYMELLEEELNEHIYYNDYDVMAAIKNLQKAYSVESLALHTSEVSYGDADARWAYLYRYATWHSVMTEYLVTRVLTECLYIPSDLFFTIGLHITCLGGGPGIDVIAFLRAVGKRYNLNDFTDVHVTVIDVCAGWNHTMDKLFSKLHSVKCFSDDIHLPYTCEFLQADLTKPLSSRVQCAIEIADVVTMIKFVSAVDGNDTEGKVPEMLKDIFDLLKTNALLFFIDNAGGGFYEMVDNKAEECREVFQVYGPHLHQLIEPISSETSTFQFQDYKRRFGCYPMLKTRVSAGVWQKNECESDEDSSNESDQDSENDEDSHYETDGYSHYDENAYFENDEEYNPGRGDSDCDMYVYNRSSDSYDEEYPYFENGDDSHDGTREYSIPEYGYSYNRWVEGSNDRPYYETDQTANHDSNCVIL